MGMLATTYGMKFQQGEEGGDILVDFETWIRMGVDYVATSR